MDTPKHAGGRPLKFETPEALQEVIDKYFDSCWTQKMDMFGNPIFEKDENGKKTDNKVMIQTQPYTISGLGVAIGLSRQGILEYEHKDQFSDTIKRAKERCEAYAESSLFIGKNPAGAIFNLKNNYESWRDKTEVEQSGGLDINVNDFLNKVYGNPTTEPTSTT